MDVYKSKINIFLIYLEKILSTLNMSIVTTRIFSSLVTMLFLLHFIGSAWSMAGVFSTGDYPETWFNSVDIQDEPNFEKYIASVYWTAVSIYTVGYGDITP